MSAVPLSDIEPLRPLLSNRHLGLFSDIDGTLSPIVPRSEDAKVTPRCRSLLRRLMDHGVLVALITGRTLDVARAMVRLDGAAYAASHGLEFWVDGQSEVAAVGDEFPESIDRVIQEANGLALIGVSIELKGQGVAFHYRQAPDEARAVAEIERVIDSAAAGRFRRIDGRKVIELRPRVEADKGTAARRLAHQLGVKSIICLGDDRTDIDMFRAVAALHREGVKGRSVAVLSPEAPPDLLAAADYSVDGVPGVEWLMAQLAEAVRQTAA